MADPVSVTGTVVGVVSLGLTLCQGLTEYVQALKCRRGDIESISRQIDILRSAFVVIKAALPKLSSDHQNAGEVVKKSLRSCEDELMRLSLSLEEFRQDQSSSGSFNQQLRQKAQKLSYPFKQGNLRRLENSIQKLNDILSTALQATELFVTPLSF
jgi:hypothetical protein